MKTLKISAIAILGLLAAACNDDDDNKNTAKLTSQEQAEMVASSMGQSGFAGSAEQSAMYADDATASGRQQECGYTNEGDFNLGGTFGQISFNLDYDYNVALNCNGSNEPESFSADFDYEGSYNGPRFESDYAGSGDLTITSLGSEDDQFTLNGSYDRSGSFKTKLDGEVQEEGQHSLDIDADDVMISKETHKIMSGSADVSASGSIEGRGSYSFDADVTFNSNGTATIKVAGDTYTLTFSSNTVVKVD
ncbi:MAG: hypothetical protein U0U09_04965 [Cyclobacteriaceae bacterium]